MSRCGTSLWLMKQSSKNNLTHSRIIEFSVFWQTPSISIYLSEVLLTLEKDFKSLWNRFQNGCLI